MTADRTEPLGRKIIFLFPLYGASNMWTASASNPDGTGGEGGRRAGVHLYLLKHR